MDSGLLALLGPGMTRGLANAPPPACRGARVAPCLCPLPQKMRGSRAPTGAGAEAPHPVTRLAVGSISGSPEITGGIRPPARLSTLCCGSNECLSAFAQLRSALACPGDEPGPL